MFRPGPLVATTFLAVALSAFAGCTYVGDAPKPQYSARIIYLSTGTTSAEGERGAAYLIGAGPQSGDAAVSADAGSGFDTRGPRQIQGIGGRNAPAVQGVSISPDGSMAAAVTEEGLDVVGIPGGKNLFALPFRAPPRFSQFFSGPVFSGNARRIGFAIPGLIGPGGAEALHVLIHRLALDGTGGGTPLPLPPSGNLVTAISLSSNGDRGVVWAAPPLAERLPNLYLLDFLDNKTRPIGKDLVPLSPAVMTSNGKEVIVSALSVGKTGSVDEERPQLFRIGVKSGKARKITRITQPAALRPLSIGSDGSVLFSVSPATQPKETQLRLISPEKGATSVIREKSRLIRRLAPGQSLMAGSVSPDRSLLAYVVCDPPPGEEAITVKCAARQRTLGEAPSERVLAEFSQPVDKIGFLSPPMIGWVSLKPPRLDH